MFGTASHSDAKPIALTVPSYTWRIKVRMHGRLLVAVSLLVTVCNFAPAHAAPFVIDFDALGDGEAVTDQFAGVTFSNTTAATAGVSLNEIEHPPHSGANAAFDDNGPVTISFASTVSSVGGYFTYSSSLTLEAFDSALNSLGTVTSAYPDNRALSGEIGSVPNEFLQLSSITGIAMLTITGDAAGFSFTFDDLTFDSDQGPTPVVPEPGTLLLVLTGSGLASLVRRRSR